MTPEYVMRKAQELTPADIAEYLRGYIAGCLERNDTAAAKEARGFLRRVERRAPA